MKVAYLVNQYPQPSQSFIRREIAALEAHGQDVLRFTVRPSDGQLVDPMDKAEREKTRAVLDVGAFGLLRALIGTLISRPAAFLKTLKLAFQVGRRSDRGLLLHLIYLAEACVLVGWFKECGVDHVHAHFGTNSTTVAMFCRTLGGPPYSFTTHGPEEFDKPQAIALGEKVHRSAFAVAISEFGKSQLYRWTPFESWGKVQIICCGVDAMFLRNEPTAPPPIKRLVCVGRLAEQKGQVILIEAAAKLASQGVDFEVVIVGDGPLRGPIEALIDQHGLNGRVRLAGWQSNAAIRELILDSRAMVLPSFAEGLPVALMEALALARPVISTYVAAIPELVVPGVCGWLVPPGSADALARAMREVFDAPDDEIERMGRAGAALVAKFHDASTEAKRLKGLFAGGPVSATDPSKAEPVRTGGDEVEAFAASANLEAPAEDPLNV